MKKSKVVVAKTKLNIAKEVPVLKLDLGSGPRPAEGFKGVDRVKNVTHFTFDLCSGERWPFDDNSVDELRSSHFIEHIKADYIDVYNHDEQQDAMFFFFDECFRIIKPGGTFTVQWPALKSNRAFQDPTHRRFIPDVQMGYFNKAVREANGLQHYLVVCDWLSNVVPTIDYNMSLRHEKIQQRLYRENWEYAQDFIATLKANK